ncbi:DUF202 domain-containing protein [Nocardia uniformis]|uniref:DUF202 domain-containing protein n=1 Tax=Nocardia uniformis TaxID=53432 RepID=A0A849C8N4_9NOCA|nr:DUF202 domain-containing protein [Nocardia uniformis]NNH72730.1 DUF202 domain-containing protein [Nocardia uniformis]
MTDAPISDTGLAAERTALSWRRTAVAAMANVALFLHAAANTEWRPAAVAPLAVAVALAAVVVTSVRRGRVLHTAPRHEWGGGRSAVAIVAVSVVGAACVAAGFELAYSFVEP